MPPPKPQARLHQLPVGFKGAAAAEFSKDRRADSVFGKYSVFWSEPVGAIPVALSMVRCGMLSYRFLSHHERGRDFLPTVLRLAAEQRML